MDPLEWILSFVDQISAPAKAMAQNVRLLRTEIKALQEQSAKASVVLGGSSGGRRSIGADPAIAYMRQQQRAYKEQERARREYEQFWAKSLAAQDRLQAKEAAIAARAAKAQENAAAKQARIAARAVATQERIQAKEARLAERAHAKELAMAARAVAAQERAAAKQAKIAARAAEKAAHKSYFGGEKSISGLFAKRAESKISGMATGAVDSVLNAPGRIISGMGSAIGGVAGAFATAAEGAAGIAFSLGKAAVEAQAMREDSVVAMTQLFGSSDKANELFDIARQAAKETKLDTKDMIAYYTTLARSFTADEVKNMAWTIADIESVRAGKGELFTRAIGKLKGGGPKAGFGAFQSAVALGPEWTNVLPVLSQALGKKTTLSRVDVQKMMRKGEIGTDVALKAIVDATNKLLNPETGKAGEFAKKTGGATWSGVLSNIKNAMGDVLNMRLSDTHPINNFKKLLQSIGAPGGILDQTSKRGMAFEKIIADAVSHIFRLIGVEGASMERIQDGLLSGARQAVDAFGRLVDYINSEIKPALLAMFTSSNLDQAVIDFVAKMSDLIATGVARAIVNGVSSAASAIPRAIDTGVESLLGKVFPSLTIEGIEKARAAQLPQANYKIGPAPMSMIEEGPPRSFASGGIVPGPYGAPRHVIAHAGEKFLGLKMPDTRDWMGGGGGRGAMPAINVTVYATGGDEGSDIRATVKQGVLDGWLSCLEQQAAMQGMGPRPS